MSEKDGGPAFPHHRIEVIMSHDRGLDEYSSVCGLSVRDYFAAHATDADIAAVMPTTTGDCWKLCEQLGISCGDGWRNNLRAWARYQHADAMLRERERSNQ